MNNSTLEPNSPQLSTACDFNCDKRSGSATVAQVTRRQYRDSALTLPLLGFGMMRLPKISADNPAIDYAAVEQMFARALAAGVNYFDTAYFYHEGKSEVCAGEVLAQYPRDSYYLATKMPVRTLTSEADAERIFKEQLTRCKTGYFDFYLMHFLNRDTWQNATRFKLYDFLRRQQSEGRIGRIGFSFHDTPEVLDKIARAHPWDFAQIQLNYLDWTIYRSREQYEILTRLDIPVIVMEPLRGGSLGNLTSEAMAILQQAAPQASAASWAFRYAASLPNVMTVLSGMTFNEHLEDNIRTFRPLKTLSKAEREVLAAALLAYRKGSAVPCTDCQYCLPCPAGVQIPRIFGLYNQYKRSNNFFHFNMAYGNFSEKENIAACIACGACLSKCPQKINIPEELQEVAAAIAAGNKK